MRFLSRSVFRLVPVASFIGAPLASVARGEAFEGYRLMASFALPPGAAAFDDLEEGRLIAIVADGIYRETGVGSRQFTAVGTLPGADIPSYGAAFIRVSPDGLLLAIGNNGGAFGSNYQVGVFDLDTLSGTWFSAGHFDGAWVDNNRVAVTYGDFVNPSIVSILDVTSPDPENPVNTTVIDSIGGASGGIAFDADGNLFTGNGFQFAGPSGTGTIKAFSLSDWTGALTGTALNFETEGTLVIDILSASPIDFDSDGNLFVGGGDFSSADHDFVGLVRGAAIAGALAGGGPVNPADPLSVRRLDPDATDDSNFYSAVFNGTTKELYVRSAGSDAVFVYRDLTGIPAASAWGLLCMVCALGIIGTLLLGSAPARPTEYGKVSP